MTDINWKDRLESQRDNAAETIASLAASARQKLEDINIDGRQIAQTGIERGAAVAKQGRKALDKAVFSSRGLIAERPLTAIAIGIVAGGILGVLANRLARRSAVETSDEMDEPYA